MRRAYAFGDLAQSPAHADIVVAPHDCLLPILDPEAVNRQAFADQVKTIEKLGGLEAVRALPSFNHTPLAND